MTTPPDPARDYYVVTREDRTTGKWGWDIHRRSKPLGVRLYQNGLVTEAAAKRAGEKALRQLLEHLAEEEKRSTE